MELIITVPDEAKVALEQRARERGCRDVTTYVERLITTDLLAAKSFESPSKKFMSNYRVFVTSSESRRGRQRPPHSASDSQSPSPTVDSD